MKKNKEIKIYGLCLIKNEADIIEYSLQEHSKWAEKIFIIDNGSEDNTWEIVNELAKTNPKLVPWKKEAAPYRDGIRADIFNRYRHEVKEGDWWCVKMDTDEFYIDDPREFLSKVPFLYQVVNSDSFEYKLTWEDIEEFEFTNTSPHDTDQVKYYSPYTYSEARFFRHRDKMVWPNTEGWPIKMGTRYHKRIRLKHHQYRSPEIIQKRLDTRRAAAATGYKNFNHSIEKDWREKIEYRKDLIKETPDFPTKGCRIKIIPRFYYYYFQMLMHLLKIWP